MHEVQAQSAGRWSKVYDQPNLAKGQRISPPVGGGWFAVGELDYAQPNAAICGVQPTDNPTGIYTTFSKVVLGSHSYSILCYLIYKTKWISISRWVYDLDKFLFKVFFLTFFLCSSGIAN